MSNHHCQACDAVVESGHGLYHSVGVAVANPTMTSSLRLVRILTCMSVECVARKNELAAAYVGATNLTLT